MQNYKDIADKIFIPFNETGQWHPEFEGYEEGTEVKQADVILLGYPLLYEMSKETRKNDLNIYEKVTPGGPAMTWGMFAIGWLEIGNIQKAKEIFERQFLNNAGPFNIWTEVADGNGAVNFITGMGGFLQSVIFGYGGFRILPNQLAFNCNLPPDTNQLNIYGLDYLGGSLDFNFTEFDMMIQLTKKGSVDLKIVLSNGQTHDLRVGQTLQLQRQKASIEKMERKTKTTTRPNYNTYGNDCQKVSVHCHIYKT
ncbi:hypothetical protein KUTeg_013289 [Tegillarca granosa]|uniref:Glycoside hydrolase family 65 central catalytic domain-containing protein n=1 Tax=Tegillarca granosa TaxID=220873 RepID=A0ABQ9EYE5_TEGGR|nr:hypothetical protein KUTeg_013289 [Tegillarca granosa]